jgi:hypothetical protein
LFNINCFAGADAVASAQEEEDVRKLHQEMIEEQLPQLIARFAEGVSAPLDGFGLVEMMHNDGINVRLYVALALLVALSPSFPL